MLSVTGDVRLAYREEVGLYLTCGLYNLTCWAGTSISLSPENLDMIINGRQSFSAEMTVYAAALNFDLFAAGSEPVV